MCRRHRPRHGRRNNATGATPYRESLLARAARTEIVCAFLLTTARPALRTETLAKVELSCRPRCACHRLHPLSFW
jgi:hypothetical protein